MSDGCLKMDVNKGEVLESDGRDLLWRQLNYSGNERKSWKTEK